MVTLFVYDGGIIKSEDGTYYTEGFGDKLIERYSFFKQEVEFLMREIKYEPGDERKYSRITHENFKFTGLPNLNSIKGITLDRRKINKIIKARVKDCEIVIARLPSLAGFKAVWECKRMNKPYLIELVACPWDAFWNHSTKGKLLAPFMYFTTKEIIKNAPFVIYVTNEFLQKRYPTRGNKVNCSNVTLKAMNNNTLENRLMRIEKTAKKGKLIIGTTAAVNVRYKGQQFIIEALGKLKRRGVEEFEYQLVGGGNQDYLRRLAEENGVADRVKFLGPLPHDKVFEWLDTIDLYSQPSLQEGLPRSLIEAMSRGLPAFGSQKGGIPELLQKDYTFSNKNDFIDEICNILLSYDKDSMKIQAKRNFDHAMSYDVDLIERRRQTFYEQFRRSAIKTLI